MMLASFITAVAVSAQNPTRNPDAEQKKEAIHIVADLLTSDNETRTAEFSGNVRATQGDTVITSDKLKIFYAEGLASTKNSPAGEGSIKKIIASGNVKILFDNRVAVTQQAVYNTDTMILVLTGPNSKITSGNDSVKGEKITYNRSNGRVTVESGDQNRVEAVFHSQGSDIR